MFFGKEHNEININDNELDNYDKKVYIWLDGLYLIIKTKYLYKEKISNQNITKIISNKLIPIMNIMKNNKWFGISEITDKYWNIF